MNEDQTTRRIRLLCRILAGLTLVLVGLGSYVRGTGAGLACPDWPLCFDRAFPELVDGVRQEVLHRYLAAIVGVLTVVLVLISFLGRIPTSVRSRVRRFSVGVLLLVIVQAVFGGLTVLMLLNPFVVTMHLALGTLFFQAVALVSFERLERYDDTAAGQNGRGARALVLLGILATLFQIVLGGFIGASGASLVCPGFPLCDGRLLGESAPQIVHMLHRIIAFLLLGVAGLLVLRARRQDSVLRARKGHLMGISFLMLLQLLIGVGNLHMKISTGMTVAHLLIAELILLAFLALYRDVGGALSVIGVRASGDGSPFRRAVNT